MPAIESTATATTMTVEEVTELQLQIDSLMNELNAIKASNIVRRENNIVILNEKLKEHQKTMNVVQSTMNTIDQQHLKEIAQLNQTHTEIVDQLQLSLQSAMDGDSQAAINTVLQLHRDEMQALK